MIKTGLVLEGRAIIIQPESKVDIKRIETDIEKIRNLYNKGYQDGKLALI